MDFWSFLALVFACLRRSSSPTWSFSRAARSLRASARAALTSWGAVSRRRPGGGCPAYLVGLASLVVVLLERRLVCNIVFVGLGLLPQVALELVLHTNNQ